MRPVTALAVLTILGGACAVDSPAVAPQRLVEVRVQMRELADGEARDSAKVYANFSELSEPLARGIVFERAHVGQVLVAGIWTVIYELAQDDVRWLQQLRRQHGDVFLLWDGKVCGSDNENGYFQGVSAKRAAEELLARLPVRHRGR